MLWLLYSLSCHLRLLIITFGFFKKLTYVVFYDDNLLIHVNFTHLNNILKATEYILFRNGRLDYDDDHVIFVARLQPRNNIALFE
jgi:hypothetical protein